MLQVQRFFRQSRNKLNMFNFYRLRRKEDEISRETRATLLPFLATKSNVGANGALDVIYETRCSRMRTSSQRRHLAIWTKYNVVLDCGPLTPLCKNMSSSTKPEVHNILHCRLKRTEPRPHVTSTDDLVKIGHVVFEIHCM